MRYRLIIVLSIVALVAGAFGISGAQAGSPPTVNAKVVNPLTEPVPVAVTNPVRVANVEGTTLNVDPGTVKVDNADPAHPMKVDAGTVGIDSSAGSPVYVRDAGGTRTPVTLWADDQFDVWSATANGRFNLDQADDFVVPDGKWLVVTGVSLHVLLPQGDHVKLSSLIQSNGRGYEVLHLPVESQGTSGGFEDFIGVQQCEVYIPSGSSVWLSSYRAGTMDKLGVLEAVLNGYLISAP